ncbi:hypothetical protein NUH88_09725 [Nisaea acidiphila]|uniref:Uncharacterized protein n=1 Tax=Nisaea acidiphila TaxID=1862145 RepID=A0A9J7AY18_9PROT|nr:hypothetical protein [Nisaea acidiphila]UUX51966.1 hypothetical protein NUH88_09725 [Nisaea acidiphila]
MRDVLGAIALLLISTFLIAGMMLTGPVQTDRTLAAIFPPWFDRTTVLGAVSESGGMMLRHGGLETVALVRLNRPDAVEQLKNSGAWAVVDPTGLFGCAGVKGSAAPVFLKEI